MLLKPCYIAEENCKAIDLKKHPFGNSCIQKEYKCLKVTVEDGS